MQGKVADNSMLANLLPFQRQIVQELIAEDGLCILSAGMGWQRVVKRYLIQTLLLCWSRYVRHALQEICTVRKGALSAGGGPAAAADGAAQGS